MGGITLRELDAKQITETVAQLCKEAAYYLPKDVYEGLKKGRETEKSPVGQAVLDQIIKNAEIARDEDRPYCQDTGMTIVFLEVGQDLHIIGGTMDRAAVMSKIALTRSINSHNPMPEYAKLEDDLLELINETGIGPQLGGTTSCLGVNIEWGPTHIAGLPVAVTICCHACRHAKRVL